MDKMTLVGGICWLINIVLAALFAYDTRKTMTKRGILLKGLSSFGIIAYAVALIVMWGTTTEGARLFVIGMVLAAVGDILVALLQQTQGDESGFLQGTLSSEFNIARFGIGVAGVLFIVGYFFEMVAFIKGLGKIASPSDYVIPFILFFVLPPAVTVAGAPLTKIRIPNVSMNSFIIGLFYGLLATALYSSATTYALALSRFDINHAVFVFVGATFFYTSIVFILVRYMSPKHFENVKIRYASRLVTFLGKMTLAGCAFLF